MGSEQTENTLAFFSAVADQPASIRRMSGWVKVQGQLAQQGPEAVRGMQRELRSMANKVGCSASCCSA